jgi:hypothetical protein
MSSSKPSTPEGLGVTQKEAKKLCGLGSGRTAKLGGKPSVRSGSKNAESGSPSLKQITTHRPAQSQSTNDRRQMNFTAQACVIWVPQAFASVAFKFCNTAPP